MSSGKSIIRTLDETHVPMLLARLVLGGLFIWMGISKVAKPVVFLKNIREYHLLPETPLASIHLINLTAIALPWIEILCGVLLIVGFCLRGSSFSILAMLVVFTSAIIARTIGVYRAGDIALCDIQFDCGCGANEIIICEKVLQNSALIGLALIALLSRSRLLAVEKLSGLPARENAQ